MGMLHQAEMVLMAWRRVPRAHDAPLFCALLPQSSESASHAREGNFFPIRTQNGTGGKRPCVRGNLPASANLRPHCRKYLGAGKPGGTVWSMAQAWKSLQVFRSSFTILQKYLVCEDTLDRPVERADKAGECLACRENVGGWFYLDYLILNTSRTRKNQFFPARVFSGMLRACGKKLGRPKFVFCLAGHPLCRGKTYIGAFKEIAARGGPYARGKTAARAVLSARPRRNRAAVKTLSYAAE